MKTIELAVANRERIPLKRKLSVVRKTLRDSRFPMEEERRKEPRTFDFTFVHAAYPAGGKSPRRRGCNRWHVLSLLPSRALLLDDARFNHESSRVEAVSSLLLTRSPPTAKGVYYKPDLSVPNEFSFTVDREPPAERPCSALP